MPGPLVNSYSSAAAGEGAGALGNMLRTLALAIIDKMVSDVLPEAKKTGGKAVRAAREERLASAPALATSRALDEPN